MPREQIKVGGLRDRKAEVRKVSQIRNLYKESQRSFGTPPAAITLIRVTLQKSWVQGSHLKASHHILLDSK